MPAKPKKHVTLFPIIMIIFISLFHILGSLAFLGSSFLLTRICKILLIQISSLMQTDETQILQYKYLHYPIDSFSLVLRNPQNRNLVYIDPFGERHLYIESIQNKNYYFPSQTDKQPRKNNKQEITSQIFENLSLIPHKFHFNFLDSEEIETIYHKKLICLDQIKLKSQANYYREPQEFLTDIKTVFAWNQIYRTKSYESIAYLSQLFLYFIQLINRKKFHQCFQEYKNQDFKKVLSFQKIYKLETKKWPSVPTVFRSYSQIDHYVSNLPERDKIVQEKFKSKKKPIECPANCVCFSDQFCTYSLKEGWKTECQNRKNKIQCDHPDIEKAKMCRNSQIKKRQSVKCKKSKQQKNDENELEQCVVWGIDSYTRNIIFNSLPTFDMTFLRVVENKQGKNRFIENELLRAMNILGNSGYNIEEVCKFIINKDKRKTKKHEQKIKSNKFVWNSSFILQEMEQSFLNVMYSEIIIKSYQYCKQFCKDKTAFRIHSKGKGVTCSNANGIQQGKLITQYYGEVYEAWRWYEKQDAIKSKKNQHIVPQFYNIFLETHKDDPEGYDMLIVDPISKGNFASRFSHSCNPNCGTVVTISDGKYSIGMYSFRNIEYGQQLTFDYCSMTESQQEHKNSICLCGMANCRGNYLSLANQAQYNDLINNNSNFLQRNSIIIRSLQPLTEKDQETFKKYNVKQKMLDKSPQWLQKWTSLTLQQMEKQGIGYKKQLKKKWKKSYPWRDTENKNINIELYSQTYKQELFSIRFQNLFITLNKINYILSSTQTVKPPLAIKRNEGLVHELMKIMDQVQNTFISHQMKEQSLSVQFFILKIRQCTSMKHKLFLFRLGCLYISHIILFSKDRPSLGMMGISDMLYFYAFTHTYFTFNKYNFHSSKPIQVHHSSHQSTQLQPQYFTKKYGEHYIWSQMIQWYKQTQNPQFTVNKYKNRYLSYPSFPNKQSTFTNQSRNAFLQSFKALTINTGTQTNYTSKKNSGYSYGTVRMDSVYYKQTLKSLQNGSLIQSCIQVIGRSFKTKLQLFKQVQFLVQGVHLNSEQYQIINSLNKKVLDRQAPINLKSFDYEKPMRKRIHKQEMIL